MILRTAHHLTSGSNSGQFSECDIYIIIIIIIWNILLPNFDIYTLAWILA
jgi:hypothetical protein